MQNPADALIDQFLGWIADGGRSYGEVMDAWRTSCPRLSIWEDALGDGLVRIANREDQTREQARVTITERGRARLNAHAGAVVAKAVPPVPPGSSRPTPAEGLPRRALRACAPAVR